MKNKSVVEYIVQFGREDLSNISDELKASLGFEIRLKTDRVEEPDSELKEDPSEYYYIANVDYVSPEGVTKSAYFALEYHVDGDNVELSDSMYSLARREELKVRALFKYWDTNSSVKASTSIMAAGEDEAAGEEFETVDMTEEDSSDLDNALDDMSDQIDDIQENVDEMDDDEIDIEMDNNIANKYIVECDACHGIFISALSESDQEIEKVSGTCPLCNKESDQYIKWIVREIDRK